MKITSTENISIELHSPEVNSQGWVDFYCVSLSGNELSANIRVTNHIYGESPIDFFNQLFQNRNGWEGEKSWSALEGEFQFFATSDKTGHITLTAKLCTGTWEPFWSTQVSLIIESGQLEHLICEAETFFHPTVIE